MKNVFLFIFSFICSLISVAQVSGGALKDAFADRFLIGTAVSPHQLEGKSKELICSQFNAVVAENCMKCEALQKRPGVFDFSDADKIVDFAEANGLTVTGHCLVWHQQTPEWFFKDKDGNYVDREELIKRMRTHIYTVVGHFRGRILGWDVVNEAIEDNGELRRSKWLEIIGPDFIELAFKFAHEADPEAELYYNDYSMERPGKRKAVVEMIGRLRKSGCRIDAVGMQSHLSLGSDLKEYEASLKAFAAAGVKVMATELDVTVLPWRTPNAGADLGVNGRYDKETDPYRDGLPKDVAERQADFYERLFDIYLRHSDVVSRVTFWGLTDGNSWKNDWPVRGRTDYPLLFSRDGKQKPFVARLMEMGKKGGR